MAHNYVINVRIETLEKLSADDKMIILQEVKERLNGIGQVQEGKKVWVTRVLTNEDIMEVLK